MKVNKTVAIVVLVGLILDSLGAGVFLSQWAPSFKGASSAQVGNATLEACAAEENNGDEANDAIEAPNQAGITADEARAAAEAANPVTRALGVELEYENGTLVYEVELDNGLEVMVDAANGNILGTERDEAD